MDITNLSFIKEDQISYLMHVEMHLLMLQYGIQMKKERIVFLIGFIGKEKIKQVIIQNI